MAGQARSMSLAEFAAHSGLYTGLRSLRIYIRRSRTSVSGTTDNPRGGLRRLRIRSSGTPCALTFKLAQYFASAHHRQERGELFGGAYVTRIAFSLAYHLENDRDHVGPVAQPKRMGRNELSGMHVTKDFQDWKRFKKLDDTQYEFTQLPEQFPPVYPPHDPEAPGPHEPAVVILQPAPPRGPPCVTPWLCGSVFILV
ncbi:hypothetical protein Hdeb2414_s0009g00321501 [Helianthus debilis subsp. tardiflorus]